MFNSLVSWCKFPVFIHSYTGIDGAGDKAYAEPVESKCYWADEVSTVTDKYGKTYVSHAKVYLQPAVRISDADMLSTVDDKLPREIHKLSSFFDGNTGKRSIWVAYL